MCTFLLPKCRYEQFLFACPHVFGPPPDYLLASRSQAYVWRSVATPKFFLDLDGRVLEVGGLGMIFKDKGKAKCDYTWISFMVL